LAYDKYVEGSKSAMEQNENKIKALGSTITEQGQNLKNIKGNLDKSSLHLDFALQR